MNKTYPVYNFDFFDESIEENNAAFSVLSKESKIQAEEESNNGYEHWFSGVSNLQLDKILKYVWSKHDVDNFIKEFPECGNEIFNIYTDNYEEYKPIKYCPIQENRENIINQILL